MTTPLPPSHVPFQPGDVVDGRFNVKREIARGGTCIVHEAEHVHLGVRVALKSLTPSALASRGLDLRLLREARALAVARHPNVVEALDAGIDREGRPYVALAMIEGRSLDGLLAARGRLDVASTVAIVVQLADALDHVHAAGVVHRDLKPSNVMIARDARDAEIACLIDFGIASLDSSDRATPKLTHVGDTLGTYEYMPAEQLFGDPVDHRADVYALGVTLYECLAGDVPFPGGHAGVAEAVLTGRAPPSIASLVGSRGRELDGLLARALARRPEDRFASAGELARAVCLVLGMVPAPLSVLGPPASAPSSAAGTREGRRFPRAPYVTPVRVLREGKPSVDGRSEDISEGGMLLLVGTQVEDGERVQVRFSLPSSGALVTVPAVTRWTRGSHAQAALGLAFSSLEPRACTDIRGFVALMGS